MDSGGAIPAFAAGMAAQWWRVNAGKRLQPVPFLPSAASLAAYTGVS
jgi:hypothetical protein